MCRSYPTSRWTIIKQEDFLTRKGAQEAVCSANEKSRHASAVVAYGRQPATSAPKRIAPRFFTALGCIVMAPTRSTHTHIPNHANLRHSRSFRGRNMKTHLQMPIAPVQTPLPNLPIDIAANRKNTHDAIDLTDAGISRTQLPEVIKALIPHHRSSSAFAVRTQPSFRLAQLDLLRGRVRWLACSCPNEGCIARLGLCSPISAVLALRNRDKCTVSRSEHLSSHSEIRI